MDKFLKLEELAQVIASIFVFTLLDYRWWVYPALIMLPDLSMLGYAVNPKVGAWMYNLFHNKILAFALLIIGYYTHSELVALWGTIFLGHASFDRIMGYGLKYNDSFSHTHLGWIGKNASKRQ